MLDLSLHAKAAAAGDGARLAAHGVTGRSAQKAAACTRRLADGIDPIDARDAERAAEVAPTAAFRKCAGRFVDAREAGWRNQKHPAQWRGIVQILKNRGLLKPLMVATDTIQVEKVVWALAAHLGQYQKRFGEVPIEETRAILQSEYPSDDQLEEFAQGMDTLLAIVMVATGAMDDNAVARDRHVPVHSQSTWCHR